ncbi:MAG: hypothetical protein JWQ62_271 [Lacunisphaera sp.]|nr:hypothetical protein [Lacunisphaera sp.]
MRIRFLPLVAFLFTLVAAHAAEPASPRRVVVVVFDGMRPDFITPETTPNLWRLAQRGVFFAHHHPVYLSSTEVNGTAIATGAYPARSFVIANKDFRPRIDPQKPVDTQDPAAVSKGDAVSGGHYLGAPTAAEILHAHGQTTAIAGSKQVALLHDRSAPGEAAAPVRLIFEGATGRPAPNPATAALGPFPENGPDDDKHLRDAWTTRALLEVLWREAVPAYSLLWLAEPDSTQHITGPGTPAALVAIKSSDDNLGRVLAELERRGLTATTDVLVVSDHAFSTIARKVDVAVELSTAGFAAKRAAPGGLQSGDVLAVGNGGSTLLYVGRHDAETVRKLVGFLQQQDWVGVIFSRTGEPGTFPLSEAHIDSPEAPDLVVSLRWMPGKSANGTPGLHTSDLAPTANKFGNHASLSPYDMHNTLVAAGPDFRRGVTNTLPSANTDLAPTVLWLLGLPDEAKKMDGRVLGEALTIEAPPLKSYELKRLTAHSETGAGTWSQYLQVSEVNGVRYLDEGNGANQPPPAPAGTGK